jgi:hypothetical protein
MVVFAIASLTSGCGNSSRGVPLYMCNMDDDVNVCPPGNAACAAGMKPNCPGGGNGPPTTDIGGHEIAQIKAELSNVKDIQIDVGNVVAKRGSPAPAPTTEAQLAATAEDIPGSGQGKNRGPAFSSKNSPGSGSNIGPLSANTSRKNSSNSGTGGMDGGSGSGLKLGMSGAVTSGSDADAVVDSSKTNFANTAGGAGYEIAVGRGGSSNSAYGTTGPVSTDGTVTADEYFVKSGPLSLFEIVSRRYATWSSDLVRNQK